MYSPLITTILTIFIIPILEMRKLGLKEAVTCPRHTARGGRSGIQAPCTREQPVLQEEGRG